MWKKLKKIKILGLHALHSLIPKIDSKSLVSENIYQKYFFEYLHLGVLIVLIKNFSKVLKKNVDLLVHTDGKHSTETELFTSSIQSIPSSYTQFDFRSS